MRRDLDLQNVAKFAFLNCSTTTTEPALLNMVKCRWKVSVAQSFPHVPESVALLT